MQGLATIQREGTVLTIEEVFAYALGEVKWDDLAAAVAARLEEGESASAPTF